MEGAGESWAMWCDDEPEPEPEERSLTSLHWAVHANDAEAVGAALSDARQDGAASLDALLEAWTPDVKAQFACKVTRKLPSLGCLNKH